MRFKERYWQPIEKLRIYMYVCVQMNMYANVPNIDFTAHVCMFACSYMYTSKVCKT